MSAVGNGLTLRDVTVAFGPRVGLRNLSLHVAGGERVALLGPSGVGKTSLLRAIAGLDPVVAGRIDVSGRDVTQVAPERRSVVYLHQTPALFPHLSVLDNVGFPLEVRGVGRAEARERGMALLARVQLTESATRSPSGLSGGQRHRVALARALAAEPDVLLLDEPFAALDPALRAEVRDAVFAMLEAGGARGAASPTSGLGPAVLLVTHDIDEAATLASRVVVLMDSAIAQDDAPAELLARPRDVGVARFLGLPNIIEGVRDAHGLFRSALGTVRSDGSEGRAWFVSRADAILASREDRQRSAADDDARTIVCGEVVSVHDRVGGVTVRVRVRVRDRGQAPVRVGAEETVDVVAVPERGVALSPGDVVTLRVDLSRVSVTPDPIRHV